MSQLLTRARVMRFAANAPHHKKERICILGSGWAGYKFMQDIDTNRYSVSMVSPRNHFLFTPLLASAAVGGSNIESVCQPVRPLVAEKNARFYEAKATKIDKEKKVVTCQTVDGKKFPLKYDKLVISVGFQANDFGIKDLEKHAFFMKETADARQLHDHILRCFEEASYMHLMDGDDNLSATEEKMIRDKLSFVVVGAGPTGTELSGELSDFLHNEVALQYPHLKQFWSVSLIEAASKILGPFQNENLQETARQHLEKSQGVKVHTSEFVSEVKDHLLSMKSGKEFPFSTLVWCAGIKPLKIVSELGLQMNEKGSQILTDKTLRVKNEPMENGVFAIGDCATIENFWLPQTAQIAAQQGTYLAEQLNELDETEMIFNDAKPEIPGFMNQDRGTLAYIGGTAALYRAPSPLPNITGVLGWFTWKSAYWSMQLSWRNRAMLTVNWFMNFAFGRDLTRVGTGMSAPGSRSQLANASIVGNKAIKKVENSSTFATKSENIVEDLTTEKEEVMFPSAKDEIAAGGNKMKM